MVFLNISNSHFTIVLLKEFLVFISNTKEKKWVYQQTIKCAEKTGKSHDASIECSNFSPCGKYFGICYDKNIFIYGTLLWDLLFVTSSERKASCLCFFPNSNTLLLANKCGSATFYSFSEGNLVKGEQYLGHNSMLTGALVTEDENFIITCDRDEKIRVSNYPNVYNIENFCLGHKQFVTYLGFLPLDKRILISCSGDGTIRFWNFLHGNEISVYDCNAANSQKTVITKISSCSVNNVSILAVVEYKSSDIKILSVKGTLTSLISIELLSVLQLPVVPWDVGFFGNQLVCLLPHKEQPVIIWSPAVNNTPQDNDNFISVKKYLNDNWNFILNTSYKMIDAIPVLFKREIDTVQEYQLRKKARLLRTGKTS